MKFFRLLFWLLTSSGWAWCALAGGGYQHLMRPIYGEPTLMRLDHRSGFNAFEAFTGFIDTTNVAAFTAMCWMRVTRHPWHNPTNEPHIFVHSNFSVEPARSTTEGGPGIPDLLNDAYMVQPVPLSSNGTWSATCLPSEYSCPSTLKDQWQYGCYCINLTTDSPLTLTVGGAGLYIPVTNCMIRNIQAVSADRSVTIAAESANASVNFGIGVNPLVQFCSAASFSGVNRYGLDVGGGLRTNEWRLVVMRGRIENGKAYGITEGWDATNKFELGETTNETTLAHSRTTFARNARVRMLISNLAAGMVFEGQEIEIGFFGGKMLKGWLTDGEIEKIRDIDAAELHRRGVDE